MSRVDIASRRRQEIIDAAVAIIARQGLQKLSLSEIEDEAKMSRGQLTYYFKSKDDILLAVFDRLLQMLKARAQAGGAGGCALPPGWERVRGLLTMVLLNPPAPAEFHPLQYTFLSQIGHNEVYRERLARLYEEWRTQLTEDLAAELARRGGKRQVSPRALATLIQAILHGLTMQRAADPGSYDRQEMLDLCLDLLGRYFPDEPAAAPAANGKPAPQRQAPRTPRRKRARHEHS